MMRAHAPDAPFEMDSAAVERLMADLRAPRGETSAMRARLREFQKRLFPKAASVGRGKRTTYDLSETLRIALAFELVDMDLSTTRCIAVVEQVGVVLDRLAVSAWMLMRRIDRGEPDGEEIRTARERLVMRVALAAASYDRGSASLVGARASVRPPAGWSGRRSHLAIDIAALVAELCTVLEGRTFRLLPSEVDAPFMGLANAAFGNDDPSTWVVMEQWHRDDLVGRVADRGSPPEER